MKLFATFYVIVYLGQLTVEGRCVKNSNSLIITSTTSKPVPTTLAPSSSSSSPINPFTPDGRSVIIHDLPSPARECRRGDQTSNELSIRLERYKQSILDAYPDPNVILYSHILNFFECKYYEPISEIGFNVTMMLLKSHCPRTQADCDPSSGPQDFQSIACYPILLSEKVYFDPLQCNAQFSNADSQQNWKPFLLTKCYFFYAKINNDF